MVLSGSDISVPELVDGLASTSSATGKPIIGLTTYLEQAQTGVWDVQAAFLPKVYFEAVTNAGGIAVLLPPQPVNDEIAASILSGLDGIIMTGGKDIDPSRYGQDAHPETDEPRPDRDEWEDVLLRGAIDQEVPFLGICRGAQLLNVSLGGTLTQHLPDVIGTTRYNLGGGIFADNEVQIDSASKLGEVFGEHSAFDVKSYHHQAIDDLAQGLVVTARSDDGVIQAVELPTVPFGVAVQWHPEQGAHEDALLFEGLVAAARQYRAAKEYRSTKELTA